jgi:hypothetical protein
MGIREGLIAPASPSVAGSVPVPWGQSPAKMPGPVIVHAVIQEPFGLKLPPRDITSPKSLVRAALPFYFPMVIGIAALLALDRHPSGIIGALLGSAFIVLLVGVEFPFIRRRQRRRQQARMANLPEGGIYAGPVAMFPSGSAQGAPRSGHILLDTLGITFTPIATAVPAVTIEWRSISRIQLGPVTGKIGVGRLTLSLTDATTRAFLVPLYGSMAEILRNHR